MPGQQGRGWLSNITICRHTDNPLLEVRMGTTADYERVVAAMDKVM